MTDMRMIPIRRIRSQCILGTAFLLALMSPVAAMAQPAMLAPNNDVQIAPGKCRKIDPPQKMPSLDAMVDSAAFATALNSADWGSANELTLSARFDFVSVVHTVGSAPEQLATSATSALASSLRAQTADAPMAFRVRVKHGKTTELKVDKSELCAPSYAGGGSTEPSTRKLAFVVGQSSAGGAGPTPIRLSTPTPPASGAAPLTKIRLNKLGYATEVEILKGTGSTDSDVALVESVKKRHYTPAMLDGAPVEVWVAGDKVTLIHQP